METGLKRGPDQRDDQLEGPDGTGDCGPGQSAVSGYAQAEWFRTARNKAKMRVLAAGLPRRRDEYWKYTDPESLTGTAPRRRRDSGAQQLTGFPETGGIRAEFANGRLERLRRNDAGQCGLEVMPFHDAVADPEHWAAGLFGELESSGQQPIARGFAAENTRDADEGLFVRCPENSPCQLTLHHDVGEAPAGAKIHHVIRVEPGAMLTVLETGSAAEFANVVFEIDVQEGGQYSHIRVQDQRDRPSFLNHVFARVGQQGLFRHFTLSANHGFARNETVVELAGEGGKAHLSGAVVGGAESHHDDTVLVIHNAVNCQSRQVFKKVLLEDAVGVFQGKILVKEGAQKTDGYQISKALLVDNGSQFLAKPELEIYADDVVCSHGSTSGSADADSMFYLRSRGIPEPAALNLLAQAFLAETLEEIPDENAVEALRGLIAGHLAEQNHVRRS